ncbi:MAG: HPP family protein [Candidatus Bipolaricaulota bacterium]
MSIFDPRFRKAPGRYLAQCALAFLVIAGLIAFFSAVAEAVIVAALGSSAFIVFAMPHRISAMPRRLVGGHLVCLAVGLACSIPLREGWLAGGGLGFCVVAGASVSLAILAMVITNTEHPPAAGNALAFAVLDVGVLHIVVTVGAVLLLAVVRRALRGWLRDLV